MAANPKAKTGANQLDEAIDNLTAARTMYASRWDTLILLRDPLRGTDYDSNTRSGISDPTPTAAYVLEPWLTLADDLATHLAEVRNHAKVIYQLLNRIPSDIDTAAIARQHRCTGGEPGTEGWERPECESLADTRDGLCFACYQRRHYHRSKAGAA